MKVFAISIPRFHKRYAYIQSHLHSVSRLPWQIVGVDGAELRRTAHTWPHNADLRDSEVGCAPSHVSACQLVAEQSLACALIVEDDVVLPHNIDDIVNDVAQVIRPGEVVSLYNRTIKSERFSTVGTLSILNDEHRLIYPLESRAMRTAAAYVVEASAAARIAGFNCPARVVADNWFEFHKEGCVVSFSLAWPLPVKLLPFVSTLEADRGGRVSRISHGLNRIPLARNILAWRRGRITMERERNLCLVDSPSDFSRQ